MPKRIRLCPALLLDYGVPQHITRFGDAASRALAFRMRYKVMRYKVQYGCSTLTVPLQ
ncbi:MAG: hypothetical protein ACPLSY_02085 [Moorellaceae bacterium]